MTKLLIRSISGIKPPRLRAASLFCAAVTVVMLCLSGHAVPAAGAAAGPVPGAAEKIAASLELSGFTDPAKAKDGKTGTFATGKAGATVTVEAEGVAADGVTVLPICTVADDSLVFTPQRVTGFRGEIVKTNVTLGETPCVRYSVKYAPAGFTVIMR